MKVAIIAPPFIPVPPERYGGTELFVAELAEYLHRRGHRVIVYANAASTVRCEVRSLFPESEWPIRDVSAALLKSLDHMGWALADCRGEVDVVHMNDVLGAPLAALADGPVALTIHHPYDASLAAVYARHPEVQYVAISQAQAGSMPVAQLSVIQHGIDVRRYAYLDRKEGYLTFLGRIAPLKGTHVAIEVARRTGMPLKIAGEIQPMFRDYWETEVKPHVDGRHIEYIGEVDHRAKCELLSRSAALLFPIQWDEPFGLVMIEALACGTPVLALRAGSVPEVIDDGTSGRICDDVEGLVQAVRDIGIAPEACRAAAERRFSLDRMGRDYEALFTRLVGGTQTTSLPLASRQWMQPVRPAS